MKNLIAFLQTKGLQIVIDSHMNSVDLLDTNLKLESNEFKPCRRQNEKGSYIGKESNEFTYKS